MFCSRFRFVINSVIKSVSGPLSIDANITMGLENFSPERYYYLKVMMTIIVSATQLSVSEVPH